MIKELQPRSIIPLALLALTAYYLLLLRPLSRNAQAVDSPLQDRWQKLAGSLEQTNALAIDFLHITNQLAETRGALELLEAARKKTAARLELSPGVRAQMSASFQLFAYQEERTHQLDEISKVAKDCQVTLEPPVLRGYPDYTADIRQPELLWAALSMVSNLLTTAIQCKVGVIHSLEVPFALTNEAPTNASTTLAELPLQLELTGSAGSLLKFLQCLPLRGSEVKAAGLAEASPDKPPLFIDRVVIKKQTPDKPDEVRVSLRALGFVLREVKP